MRIKPIKTIVAAALLAISGSALAEGSDGITIDDVTVAPGQTQSVTINYSFNDMVYHGFEMILVFPDGSPSHIVKVSDEGQEQLDCTLSDALSKEGAEFTLYSFDYGTDGYLFRSLSLKSNTIPLGEGELLSFNIEANAEATVGEKFSVTVQEARFAFKNETTDELEWKYFDPFTFDVTISDRVILDENSTKVPQASDGPADVTVLRTINPNEWSTICLPFTMTPSIFEAAFDGNTVEVAEFTGFETEYSSLDDLSPDAITLDFTVFKPTARKPLRSGTPYLIRVSEKVETIEADAVTISPTLSSVSKQDADGLNGSFVGTLGKTVVPADALFISGNKFWYSVGKTNIKAFRGWFELEPVLGKDLSLTNVGFTVDGDPVSVDGIPAFIPQPRGDIYTIQGQYVGRDVKSLPRGIYVVDGKKLYVK